MPKLYHRGQCLEVVNDIWSKTDILNKTFERNRSTGQNKDLFIEHTVKFFYSEYYSYLKMQLHCNHILILHITNTVRICTITSCNLQRTKNY